MNSKFKFIKLREILPKYKTEFLEWPWNSMADKPENIRVYKLITGKDREYEYEYTGEYQFNKLTSKDFFEFYFENYEIIAIWEKLNKKEQGRVDDLIEIQTQIQNLEM